MKLLLLLGAFVLVRTTPVPKTCTGVRITNSPVLYEREVLKTGVDRPYMLVVDYSSNILYFSYSTEGEKDSFQAASIDLKDKEFKNITCVPNGFAQAVDSTNNEVYIGGDGIYKYDPKKDTAELYAAKDANIWLLYFHDDLYYAEYPSQFLYVVHNSGAVRAKDLEDTKVDMFVIDNDNDIFYSNDTGIYCQKKGTKDAQLYKEFDDASARGLTTDKNGKVHACMVDGIYVVNKDAKRFDKIVEIDDAFGVAFDRNNNIVYSDAIGVYMLKPNENLTC
ncbi:ommochrome-binding protein-like [Hyposmocoma kahamanoa]|uniref:ommochrome-binding protein-like n=1 Tax=Hyposmocoma kahamanoa TaxID=1477025 RepID=UPI000E6D6A16|nr:ommochrome-binding protein-like [Hyposmocoma kahamanoa]